MTEDLLDETISLGAARVQLIALEDDLLKLTKRLEDLLEIFFGDTEVDVADIETVEGGAVSTGCSTALGRTSSTVLLGFSKLGNDGDALKFLASQLQCKRYRLFSFELNVADAGRMLACMYEEWRSEYSPLATAGNSILDDLSFDNRADTLEEAAQVTHLSTLRDLLDEDGALVAVVLGDLGLGRGVVATAVAAVITTVAATVAGPLAVPVVAAVARGAGTRTTSTAVEVASAVAVTASTASTAVARAAAAGPITVFICVSTFARTGAASVSSAVVSIAAATAISIGLTMTVPTVSAPITTVTAV